MASTQIKIITVQTKSSTHPYFGQGSSKGYFIDGDESPSLTFRKGVIYFSKDLIAFIDLISGKSFN